MTLVARRTERLEALSGELSGRHQVRIETVGCDLGDLDARERMSAEIDQHGLRVEVLVNNAGFGSAGRFDRLDAGRELDMVRVNVEAVVDLCGRHVPEMVRRGRGAVLNVASAAAFQPLPRQATYAASKAFVLAFTDALHAELAGSGVTATTLCPGPVRTEFISTAGLDWDNLPRFLWTDSTLVAEEGVRGLERVVASSCRARSTGRARSGASTPREGCS